jgi:uncharacterized protein (UPF0333 family)
LVLLRANIGPHTFGASMKFRFTPKDVLLLLGIAVAAVIMVGIFFFGQGLPATDVQSITKKVKAAAQVIVEKRAKTSIIK